MFVTAVIAGGIGRSGLISVSKTVVATPSRTRTAATSVTRSPPYAIAPVVSTSTTTNDCASRSSVATADQPTGAGLAQPPAAVGIAREALMSGEQRRRHVLGDVAAARRAAGRRTT